ncbi:MAG: carbon monoxide dehydrogenase [Chloroflexi bacterium]|nr:carbon monoxide dehydrogenase [Chloroflexota bacterium]
MQDDQYDVRIRPTDSKLTWANRWDHFLARCGVNRSGHRVKPGLYALGHPTPDSPVFVTANYTLSFDALRSALAGIDGYILVLDTQGINVWCAAGKGTFGTDELVRRVEAVRLSEVVNHRNLILPQLGAAGVSAYEVKRRSGFDVEYGPVRAADLPEYLKNHQATEEMRRVRFTLLDRLVLIPVELVHLFVPMALAAVLLYALSGWLAAASAVAAVLAGVVLFPILLPWLPTRDFSSKGFILGGLVSLPFALEAFSSATIAPLWLRLSIALAYLFALPPVTAFLALNFTGSTPITSRSGVKREIFTYIPMMAWMFGIGIVLAVGVRLFQQLGGA